jgi:hypothetical protein
MRVQVLMVDSMKMRASWNTPPCSLVETDQRFRGVYCLHHVEEHDRGSTWHYILEALIFM